MSLHCLLAYIAPDKKSTEIFIFVLLYVMCLFFFLGCPLSFLFMFLLQQFGYDVSRWFLSVSIYVYSHIWLCQASVVVCGILDLHYNVQNP